MPGLNDALDRFVVEALARNLPVTLANHSSAPHAFDLFDDSETSREIIRQMLGTARVPRHSCSGQARRTNADGAIDMHTPYLMQINCATDASDDRSSSCDRPRPGRG